MNHKPQETGSSNLSIFSVFRKWLDTHLADEEAILMVILIALGLWFMVVMGHVFAPLVASLIIAFLLQGLVDLLKRGGAGHVLAVSVATAIFMGLMLVTFWVLLPLLWKQLSILTVELPRMISSVNHLLERLPQKYPELISQTRFDLFREEVSRDIAIWGEDMVTMSVMSLPTLLVLAVYLVLIPLLVFFLLKDKDELMGYISRLLPERRPVMLQVWEEMQIQTANYIRGKVIEIIVVAAVSMVAFQLLHLKYSVLLGILVGLSVIIPFVGATLVTIPVVLAAWFQWGWGSDFTWLLVVYFIIQALDGNVLVPILFSEAVKLHPVVIIMAVLFFGGLWGFWGVFFAIPLATLIKAVMRAWPSREQAAG